VEQLKEWFTVIAGVAAFAANYGFLRATLAAFRREVDQLTKLVDRIAGVQDKVTRLEAQMEELLVRTLPEMKGEVQHVHDSAKAENADIRKEVSALRRDMLAAREPTRPG
jgi:cell division protein FtsB